MVGYFDFSPRDLRIKRCNLMQNDRDDLLFIIINYFYENISLMNYLGKIYVYLIVKNSFSTMSSKISDRKNLVKDIK